jgi:hypothetical protein
MAALVDWTRSDYIDEKDGWRRAMAALSRREFLKTAATDAAVA